MRSLWQMDESLAGIRIEDILLAPVYLGIIYLIAKRIKKRNAGTPVEKYVFPALGIKLFSAVMFSFMYQFFWGGFTTMGGDTGVYFQGGLAIWKSLFYNPSYTWDILFTKELHLQYDNYLESSMFWAYFDNRKSFEQLFMYRFSFFPITLALGTYLNTAFLMSLFVFLGSWKVYKIYCEKYPGLEKQFLITFFFIPSMCFWGSSLMRDTGSLASLMFLFYSVHSVFVKRRRIILHLISIFFFGRLIFYFKAYILLTFIPPILVWLYLVNISRVKNVIAKGVLGIVLLLLFSGVGYLALVNMANSSEKYALDKLEKQVEGFHSYHEYLTDKGISKSGYTIEMNDYSIFGILKAMPAAINVAIFRPYLWESRSPLILLSAIESTIVLFFFLRLVMRAGLFSLVRYLKVPEVALGVLYAIILGTACGLTAFNFGALVRFKIPFLPFFFSALFIIQHLALNNKVKNEEKLKVITDSQ